MDTRDQEADVVVVGSGILGLSVATHLRSRGVERVAVIDAGRPGMATTGAGAGFVGLWAAGWLDDWGWGQDEVEIELYGLDFYRALAERADIGFRACGNLFLAISEDGFNDRLHRLHVHPFAPDSVVALDPDEIRDLSDGAIAAEACHRGVFYPEGIRIDTGKAVAAMADSFVDAGGSLRTETIVEQLIVGDHGIEGVGTDDGRVTAPVVVTAAGAWSGSLVRTVGIALPLEVHVATRIVSRPSTVPIDFPTVVVPEVPGLWFREDGGGLTYGSQHGYASLSPARPLPGVGHRPRSTDLAEAVTTALKGPLQALLPTVDLRPNGWCQGLPVYTEDRRFIAGASTIPGLFILTGDQFSGVMHGPGLGRLVADLVAEGASTWVDADRFRADRFAQSS